MSINAQTNMLRPGVRHGRPQFGQGAFSVAKSAGVLPPTRAVTPLVKAIVERRIRRAPSAVASTTSVRSSCTRVHERISVIAVFAGTGCGDTTFTTPTIVVLLVTAPVIVIFTAAPAPFV